MSDQELDFVPATRHGRVAVLTMSYPERRNAFSLRMRTTLLERMEQLMYGDLGCGAIVLTGAGGTFCAGGDLSEMKDRPIVAGRQVIELPRALIRLMVSGPKPVVAAVEGHAIGAGLSLVCASDYVVAAAEARFAAAFVKVGLMPDTGILWTLPKRVGATKAREMMMLADEVSGTEALRIGLANELAPRGATLDAALVVATTLAAQPPAALAYLKSILGQSAESPDAALRAEVDFGAVLLGEGRR
jgi:enoyl-CoA hydratase/carnithine racemase